MLYDFLRLTRPLNGLIASISVILGAFIAGGTIRPFRDVLIVATGAFLLTSAGNALNDFWDVEADKVNKPFRPVPSGKIKRSSAFIFAIVLFAVGTGLGLLVNRTIFFLFCFVSALLVLYTTRMRKIVLMGNLAIGLLTGLTLIAGGISVKSVKGAFIPAVFAFLITVAREIIKDIEDVKGDSIKGLSSLPLRFGQRKAMYISLIFLVAIIFFSPLPYFLGIYSIYYLICVVFVVDFILIYCISILFTKFTEKTAAKVSNLIKLDIFFGLGALYLGSL